MHYIYNRISTNATLCHIYIIYFTRSMSKWNQRSLSRSNMCLRCHQPRRRPPVCRNTFGNSCSAHRNQINEASQGLTCVWDAISLAGDLQSARLLWGKRLLLSTSKWNQQALPRSNMCSRCHQHRRRPPFCNTTLWERTPAQHIEVKSTKPREI